jgi:hypothetical protein
VCWSCKSLPASGGKLRYCERCLTAAYCSKPCARAGWDAHTFVCESNRQAHGRSLVSFVAHGGQTKDYNQRTDDIRSLFLNMPGLMHEEELMAWSHRIQAPIIVVSISGNDVDGRITRMQMIPRSFWDADQRFPFPRHLHCGSTRSDTNAFWRGIVLLEHAICVCASLRTTKQANCHVH